MRDTDLLQLALGLVPPWMVKAANFDAQARRLDIEIDFAKGGRFPCPHCREADCPVHDTAMQTWRHLDFFQHQAFLHARTPRITCPDCGVKQIAVPWARAGSGFTLLFEALAMTLMTAMPVAAAARLESFEGPGLRQTSVATSVMFRSRLDKMIVLDFGRQSQDQWFLMTFLPPAVASGTSSPARRSPSIKLSINSGCMPRIRNGARGSSG